MAKKTLLDLKLRVDSAPVEILDVAELEFDAEQPRTSLEQTKIESLGASIREKGQIQNIVVRNAGGKKIVVCGERRVRACRLIGQKTVLGKSLVLTDEEVTELQMIENTQRVDMSPMEEAKAYEKAHSKGVTLSELSHRNGKKIDFIRGRLILNRLIPELQEAVDKEELSLDVAKEVAQLGADTQRGILGEIFEEVPVKLLQKAIAADADDDEDADEFETDEPGDYTEDSTPFDDADDQDISLDETENRPSPSVAVLYRKKSVSLGKVQKLIAERVLVSLSNAPFDLTDVRLHPEGRICEGCPNRNGSNTLFDLGSDNPDICLDLACYQGKGNKLVRITRETYVPADGEMTLAKTISRNYYSNSPYRQADTLASNAYRTITELGAEVPEENQCLHSEYGICIDFEKLGAVYVICADHECEVHYPKYSDSAETTGKPELSAEERSLNYQESRQKGFVRKAVEIARPVFFERAGADYDALRWIFNDEDLRLLMILRFCELVRSEKSDDFIFACTASGIKVCKTNYSASQEDKDEAELLSGYWGEKTRSLKDDLSKIDEDRLSKLLFNLSFVHQGRDFTNNPIEADAQMQAVAGNLNEDYEIIFAEKQQEIADKNRQPFAEKYFADLQAGIERPRPNLFTEYAQAKTGIKVELPTSSKSAKAHEERTAPVADEVTAAQTESEAENTVFAQAV